MIAFDVQLAVLEGVIPAGAALEDAQGIALFHRRLDAEAAHERTARELTDARKALADHAAAVLKARQEAELDANGHHTSFGSKERKSFFAKLGNLCARKGYEKEYAYDLAETVQRRIRPSAMTSAQRSEYLAWLETPEASAAYESFAAARIADLGNRIEARGPTVKCANCAAPASDPERCRACGWPHKAKAAA